MIINLSRTLVIVSFILFQIFLGAHCQETGSDTTIGNSGSQTTEFVSNYGTGSPEVAESTSSELANSTTNDTTEIVSPYPCVNRKCRPISEDRCICPCTEQFTSDDNCTEDDNTVIVDYCKVRGDEYCNGTVCINKNYGAWFICHCPKTEYFDYLHRICKKKVPPCLPNPCANGVCLATSEDSYNCTCIEGYAGTYCTRITDYCKAMGDKYCNGSVCINEEDSFTCQCSETEYFDYVHRICKEIVPPCLPNPCVDGMCLATSEDSYNCTCFEGYGGENCTLITDSCKIKGDRYCNGTLCSSGDDSDIDDFICECSETEDFDYHNRICKKVCDDSICTNNGVCKKVNGYYACNCHKGYVGKFCATKDFCAEYDGCANGTCVYSDDTLTRFFKCFDGLYKDEEMHCCREPDPPCFPNPCKNSAICTKTADANDYTCECSIKHTGKNCELTNYCPRNGICPGGKCVLDAATSTKMCACPPGFYYNYAMSKCTENELPCKPNPCNNNGVCKSDSGGVFNCTCDSLYTGEFCDVMDMCNQGGNVCVNGTCQLIPESKIQICKCDSAHFLEDGLCKEVDRRCQPNPCVRGNCNEATITVGESIYYTYFCRCFEGYKGENCSQRDRCKLDGGDAFCTQAKCIMDYEKDSFFCNCSRNEYFDYNLRVCKSLDLCPLKTCNAHQLCENNTCFCEKGYKPNITTGECEVDFCNAFGCPGQGMICDDSQSYFPEEVKCTCKSGEAFDGISCKSAHCSFPHFNNCSQVCSQGEDNFECGCFPDYEISEDKSTCVPLGNVSVACPNQTCELGVCIEIRGRPKCFCATAYGHMEQNGECIDLCTAGKLNGMCPENKCEVLDTRYRCNCTSKLKLSDDETTCTVRRLCSAGEIGHSECAKRNAVCNEDYNSGYGYNCSCADGFIETDAFECKKVCDKEDNQKRCDNLGAICSPNSFNSSDFDCKCPPLFRSSILGGPCNEYAADSFMLTLPLSAERYTFSTKQNSSKKSVIIDRKTYDQLVEQDITKSMANLFKDFVQASVLNCNSKDDVLLCKIYAQFRGMKKDLSRLLNPLICKSLEKDYRYCLIPPSTVIRKDRIKSQAVVRVADPCDEDISICPQETICKNLGFYGFACTCKEGYRNLSKHYILENSFVENCQDIDECIESEKSTPRLCDENAHCVNTMGSYNCLCNPGYNTANDTSKPKNVGCIDICVPNPCVHGICSHQDNALECRCDVGFAGSKCNFADKNCKDAKTNTVVVGAVLGGILLITVILFVATVTRLRRKKYSDEPTQVLYTTEMTERYPVRLTATNSAFEKD